MNPDATPLRLREPPEHRAVELHEGPQQPSRRIQLAAQPPLGEIDLHAVGAGLEGRPDVLFAFVHEVGDEGVTRIALDAVLGVDQADGRRRDDRLLHRPAGMPLRRGHVGSGIGRVAERTGGEPRQLPRVPVLERDYHAVRGEGAETRQRIGCEARFRLLAVGNDRRTRGFHGRHGLRHRPLHGLAQTRVVKPAGAVRAHGVDEIAGAGMLPMGSVGMIMSLCPSPITGKASSGAGLRVGSASIGSPCCRSNRASVTNVLAQNKHVFETPCVLLGQLTLQRRRNRARHAKPKPKCLHYFEDSGEAGIAVG